MNQTQTVSTEATALSGLSFVLLSEILEHLSNFTDNDDDQIIDLRGLPMSDADQTDLDEQLGVGEVKVTLSVTGRSEVWETSYAGVWRVRHFSGSDNILADQIIISRVPQILLSHPEDIRRAALRLRTVVDGVVEVTQNTKGDIDE